MLYAEQMLHAAMTEALSCVCVVIAGSSWVPWLSWLQDESSFGEHISAVINELRQRQPDFPNIKDRMNSGCE